jgi:hypothetical protein
MHALALCRWCALAAVVQHSAKCSKGHSSPADPCFWYDNVAQVKGILQDLLLSGAEGPEACDQAAKVLLGALRTAAADAVRCASIMLL